MPQNTARIVLVLGSGPNALDSQAWPRAPFTDIVTINNAWRVRPDWTHLLHPDDFPAHKLPAEISDRQAIVTSASYVPAQNQFGGFVYAGGTMAFTAGYWALATLKPDVLAFFGCDMVYPAKGNTHFYGTGHPDPLRADVTLRNLEAKSARLMLLAAQAGCHCVNLSDKASRLVFPYGEAEQLPDLAAAPAQMDLTGMQPAEAMENRLGYLVASGRYWEQEHQFSTSQIDRLDQLWLDAFHQAMAEPKASCPVS